MLAPVALVAEMADLARSKEQAGPWCAALPYSKDKDCFKSGPLCVCPACLCKTRYSIDEAHGTPNPKNRYTPCMLYQHCRISVEVTHFG